MKDCLFCKITAGEQGELIWHNEYAAAFKDINPKAAVHVLIAPKQHVKSLDELRDVALGGQLLQAVREVAVAQKVKSPYKVMIYGELVDHLHLHLMGERLPD